MTLYEHLPRSHARPNNRSRSRTVVDGPHVGAKLLVTPTGRRRSATLGHPELDRIVARDALAELEAGRSGIRHYGPEGQTTPEDLVDTPTVRVFVESWAPPPQMWIFGAVDFTAALAKVAKVLGYRVTVCDAREVFATRRRFPMADEVVVSWPGTAVRAIAAHTLGAAMRCASSPTTRSSTCPPCRARSATDVGYIGVMGSRKTHAKRMERLAEVGVDQPEQLDRLMSPIGLDLGARTPEETAISICAEIIARRTGRTRPVATATATDRSTQAASDVSRSGRRTRSCGPERRTSTSACGLGRGRWRRRPRGTSSRDRSTRRCHRPARFRVREAALLSWARLWRYRATPAWPHAKR